MTEWEKEIYIEIERLFEMGGIKQDYFNELKELIEQEIVKFARDLIINYRVPVFEIIRRVKIELDDRGIYID